MSDPRWFASTSRDVAGCSQRSPVLADPAPVDLTAALLVRAEAETATAVDERGVVLRGLTVHQVQREVEVEVACSYVPFDAARRIRHEQARYRSLDVFWLGDESLDTARTCPRRR